MKSRAVEHLQQEFEVSDRRPILPLDGWQRCGCLGDIPAQRLQPNRVPKRLGDAHVNVHLALRAESAASSF
jgi:hypothetical protein